MAAKGIFFILDGLGDRPNPGLNGRTPLEAAATPNLDLLAGTGAWGMVNPTPEGQRAHTHIGVSALFGLDAGDVSALSRGPIEMAGLGWEQKEGDVALRANLAHLEHSGQGFLVLDRRAGRIDSGVDELAASLQNLDLGDGVRASFRGTEEHRGVLCLSGPGLAAELTDTDPGNVVLPAPLAQCEPRSSDPAAAKAADAVNRLTVVAHECLRDHPVNKQRLRHGLPPANGLIVRGAGGPVNFTHSSAWGSRAVAVVAGCSTVLGLARLFGFRIYTREGFTGTVDTDLQGKIHTALEALQTHDFVYVHVKAPDIYAHECDAGGKKKFLERFDLSLGVLVGRGLVIALSTDHGTDSNTGWHIDDPVPSLVSGMFQHNEPSHVNFGEDACLAGPLGTLSASEFLRRVLAETTASNS